MAANSFNIRDCGTTFFTNSHRQKTDSLRHTFASWLVLNGEDLKSIQELMRHSTISMTMKYAHLIPDKKRQAVRNIIAPPAG